MDRRLLPPSRRLAAATGGPFPRRGLAAVALRGYRIAQGQTPRLTQALKAFAPWAVLMVALFAVGRVDRPAADADARRFLKAASTRNGAARFALLPVVFILALPVPGLQPTAAPVRVGAGRRLSGDGLHLADAVPRRAGGCQRVRAGRRNGGAGRWRARLGGGGAARTTRRDKPGGSPPGPLSRHCERGDEQAVSIGCVRVAGVGRVADQDDHRGGTRVGRVRFDVEAADRPPGWQAMAPWVGWPVVVILLFAVHQVFVWRKGRPPHPLSDQCKNGPR